MGPAPHPQVGEPTRSRRRDAGGRRARRRATGRGAGIGREPRRLLMLALYRTGRQAEALRVYRDFRKVLGDEMGVDPSADLAQLEEQILLQDPLLAPRRRAPGVGAA